MARNKKKTNPNADIDTARTAAVTAEVRMKTDKCCDNCMHYHWYYDYCDRFECEVDAREVHDCFTERKIR